MGPPLRFATAVFFFTCGQDDTRSQGRVLPAAGNVFPAVVVPYRYQADPCTGSISGVTLPTPLQGRRINRQVDRQTDRLVSRDSVNYQK